MKKIDKKTRLQMQDNRCKQIRDLVISYVDLNNRLKALEENIKQISINDSEINLDVHKRKLTQTSKKPIML